MQYSKMSGFPIISSLETSDYVVRTVKDSMTCSNDWFSKPKQTILIAPYNTLEEAEHAAKKYRAESGAVEVDVIPMEAFKAAECMETIELTRMNTFLSIERHKVNLEENDA